VALPALEAAHRGGYLAVATTGIFCRAGCPAPAPLPGNATRIASAREAVFSGYRPCLRCRPLESATDVTDAERRRGARLLAVLSAARRSSAGTRRRSGRDAIVIRMLPTPLGPMLAGATDEGICLLEFTDRPMLPTQLAVLERRIGRPVVAGRHALLDGLAAQLHGYFAGERLAFDLPLASPGSPFQQRVWSALRAIPAGTTISYEELATRAGRPGAQRAAGTANGANRLALLIPCHRVIRKTGETGNYGGGRWRKAWLLDHERRLAATGTAAGAAAGAAAGTGAAS
jgi:AraC family transcriptional regulator of adaptative response/methylated-DNA-[protein]-cysteine methyltransferase